MVLCLASTSLRHVGFLVGELGEVEEMPGYKFIMPRLAGTGLILQDLPSEMLLSS